MADEQAPAQAGQKRARTTYEAKRVTLGREQIGMTSQPIITFTADDAPEKGDTVRFRLKNGVTYSGKAREVETNDGRVTVRFKGGIAPQK